MRCAMWCGLHPWRRPQPDGGRANQSCAVDRDGRAGQTAWLPRCEYPVWRRACSVCSTWRAWSEGIPDEAYKPLAGDDKPTARYYAACNRDRSCRPRQPGFRRGGGKLPAAAPLAQERAALRALPEDSAEQIAEKRRRFEAAQADWLSMPGARQPTCSSPPFLLPKTGGRRRSAELAMVPTTSRCLAGTGRQPGVPGSGGAGR